MGGAGRLGVAEVSVNAFFCPYMVLRVTVRFLMNRLLGLLFLLAVSWGVSAYPCPDGTSECKDGTTCCKMKTGVYSCCPQPEAACCDDGEFCCPKSYACNGTLCVKSSLTTEPTDIFHQTIVATKLTNPSVSCPDNTTTCVDTNTCCQQPSGAWGCCSFERAVCCADKMHCCPEEYDCDEDTNTCIRMITASQPLVKMSKPSLKSSLESPKDVICPAKNNTVHCPDNNTCCATASDFMPYICCPFPSASCCNDKRHCCPNGYQCDDNNGTYTCSKQLDKLSMHRIK